MYSKNFFFLGLHLRHMELPRLGVKSELQLLAYTTAIATPDPSHICDLCYNLKQCHDPLSEARDRTHLLIGTNHVLNPLSHNGNSLITFSQLQFREASFEILLEASVHEYIGHMLLELEGIWACLIQPFIL